MNASRVIAVIGAGRIGLAIAIRLVKCGYRVIATRRRVELLRGLVERGVEVEASNRVAASKADVVIVAVKPWQVEGVAREISEVVRGKIVVSVAAGVKLDKLRSMFPGARVFRAMPNLGARYGLSATLVCCKGEEGLEKVVEVMGCLGRVYVAESEDAFPAWTAYSGSGFGILAALLEAFVLGGVACGVKREDAVEALRVMLEALSRMLSEKSLAEIRDEVATPGGTTIEAIRVLERGARGAIIDAVVAAFEKARRLEA